MDDFDTTQTVSNEPDTMDLHAPGLRLLASTQLRLMLRAWQARGAAAQPALEIGYGASAGLAERLRGGEAADAVLLADIGLAQSLLPAGETAIPLGRDRLVLVTRPDLRLSPSDLVERLQSSTLRIGSALPDVGQPGDPARMFFERIALSHPAAAATLQARARPLTLRGEAPSHRQVMELLVSGQMDVVLGLYSALRTLSHVADVIAPPADYAVEITAGAAILANGGLRRAEAMAFIAGLCQPDGQAMLKQHGFEPVAAAR